MSITHYLPAFLRVAETGSFTRAAEDLGLPKATVSNAVKQLEAALGTRLFHRTTRKVVLTQDGEVFFERSKDLQADIEELSGLFHQDSQPLAGRVRIDMPVAIARDMIIPALPDLLAQHPQLEIELSCTDRKIDLVREGIDFVIRVGAAEDTALIARPLGHYQMINCASPAYLKRMGTPNTLADLPQHQLVGYVSQFGKRSGQFEYQDAAGQTRQQDMPCGIYVNSTDAYFAACVSGLGIIQAPAARAVLEKALRKKKLVRILPDYPAPPMPVSLLYANRRHLPKRVQYLMDWISGIVEPKLGGTTPLNTRA